MSYVTYPVRERVKSLSEWTHALVSSMLLLWPCNLYLVMLFIHIQTLMHI
jgi:hypothetical protein